MRARYAIVLLSILALIGAVYWPISHGDFVWDDWLCFHDAAWLREGDAWKHYMLRDFCDWTNYFRPLPIALLTLQVRAFHGTPGGMHVVSLGLHLLNTLLVALLALRPGRDRVALVGKFGIAGPALFYGLHPALVEPVSWIACQFELVAVLFTLLGLICNARIDRRPLRALAVSSCFFLAACSKESAIAFPVLLVWFDWIDARLKHLSWPERTRAILRDQWPVFLGMLAAGTGYLLLRYWAMGYLSQSAPNMSSGLFATWQEICATYLNYWRIMVWPMTGQAPIHPFNIEQFTLATASSLTADLAAAAIALAGLYWSYKNKALGHAMIAASIALLPVLHLIPVAFDESLYHERYVMTALAVACALAPSVVAESFPQASSIAIPRIAALTAGMWLVVAVMNIGITLPLWSNDLSLWRWAHARFPESLTATDHLLSAYIRKNDYMDADRLADAVVNSREPCPICLLNVANLALAERALDRAEAALERIKDSPRLLGDSRFLSGYIFARGELAELEGNATEAEAAYRYASGLDPLQPLPQMALAHLLAKRGETAQARELANSAIPLFAPDEQNARREAFERIVAASVQH